MGQKVIVNERVIYKDLDWEGPKGYEIIDNKMSQNMTNQIIDICRSAFYDKSNAKDRSEYIKNRLDDLYPNIQWSVFLYTNGYCKVSFDKNYYICAKANGYYTIIFGYKKNISKTNE